MVIPTPRLLLLALFGTVAVVLSGTYDRALVVALGWLVLVVVLALLDARLVPNRRDLVWQRVHEPKLSLGVWNPVSLEFHNRSGRTTHLRVRDAAPPALAAHGDVGEGMCAPGESWQLTYGLTPTRRGDYAFGPLAARYLGPLGLAWRQHRYPLNDAVKVYPNLQAIRAYEALLHRGHLQEMGLHPMRRWGPGTQFERLREYTNDDDFRRINWLATARHYKPIAVDYQTERSQNVILVLDAGRLMATQFVLPPRDPGTADADDMAAPEDSTLTRLDYAVNASLLLAYVAQQYGDRVGLLAFADRPVRYLPPRPGRGQFLALSEALYNVPALSIETDYGAGLGYLASRNPRRALAVLFTDLNEPEAVGPIVAHVSHLARRHLVLVVTMRDPGLDAMATLQPDSSDHVYQRAVAQRTLDDRDQTLNRLRRQGVLTLDVTANQLSPSLINRYLEIKARGSL